MTAKFETLSDVLSDTHLDLKKQLEADGHLYLGREALSAFVSATARMTEMARLIENAWSQAEWNRRAYFDRLVATNEKVAEILALMHPETDAHTKIIPFRTRSRPAPSAPFGGDAA